MTDRGDLADLADLADRLKNANARLLALAADTRARSGSVIYGGARISVEADRIEAKAEGVRLALSYVDEYLRR